MQSIVANFLRKEGSDKSRIMSIRSALSVSYFSLILCCALAAALVLFFLLIIKPLVFLRADILMWEETDFVGNMIKLNIGTPLYTAPSDSNSLIYNPAAFLLTYAIAWILGQTKSVVAFRVIQLGYVVVAAVIATVCSRKLYHLAFPERTIRFNKTWTTFTFLALFLAATAPNSNKFVYSLHVDALSLLVSIICFWTMLRYAENESLKNLFIMAVCPTLGFLTKQFLISWIAVMFVFLLFQHPKNFKRLGLFVLVSGGFILIAVVTCYMIWGDNYLFWTFKVMGGVRKQIVFTPDTYSISLARSIDHLVRVWPEIFVGVIGCWLLINTQNLRRIGSLIVAWLVLVASETFSSGAGWNTLYHFGPGVLIGAVFMFTALPQIWASKDEKSDAELAIIHKWARAFVMIGAVAAIFTAWHVMPTGDKNEARYLRGIQSSQDVNRYITDIEREFDGIEIDKVLLGVGNWIYLHHDVLQKDRAVSLADQPAGGIYENFDVTVERIRNRTYQKILVQDFNSPFFLYEWSDWPRPSGFRDALLENYVEVKTIEPPKGTPSLSSQIMNSGPISVFVQRSN